MYRPYRRTTQWAVFALMFLVPVLNLYEIYAVTGTFYAINFGGLGIADPSVILQAVFAAGHLTASLAGAVVFPFLLALLFGRIWCGWMCPYHLLADGTAWLRAWFRAKFLRKPEPERFLVPVSFRANMIRFGFLTLGTALAACIAIPVLNYVNAPGILSTEAMIFVKERSLSIEMAFIAALLGIELFLFPRFWCRLFCPSGAVISLFRTPYTLKVENTLKNLKGPCCKEAHCASACPMGLAPALEADNLLCTNCGRCIEACNAHQETGRLRFSGFKRPRITHSY